MAPLELVQLSASITVKGEDPTLDLAISTSDLTPTVGVGTIQIADLPASVFQGYGGTASDYATSDLKTLDLRADLGAPNVGSTPVAAVTLADLRLDETPITSRLLNSILLPEIPIDGGWSRALMPGTAEVLVEQTISLLDVFRESAAAGRYPGAIDRIALGDLGLEASNLGSMSDVRGASRRRLGDTTAVPRRQHLCARLLVWPGVGRAGSTAVVTSEFDLVAGSGAKSSRCPRSASPASTSNKQICSAARSFDRTPTERSRS